MMLKSAGRCLLVASATATLFAACAAAPASMDGSGGATGSGGAPGSGGTQATTVGQIPFPQMKVPGMCQLTTASGASASVQSAYNDWKTSYVTANGAGSGLRVSRPGNGNDTVSEGIGYGMIAAAYMNDKPTFDGLWTYAKAHFDGKGLMNWHISSTGTAVAQSNGTEPGSASDADEDIAWALIVAASQWPGGSYLADAKDTINKMFAYSIGGDGMLRPGDGWGTANIDYFPDYFSPAYYRVFATVTNKPDWSGLVVDRGYTILAAVTGANGLVADQISANGNNFSGAAHCTIANGVCTNYTYDACRTPWRIGMDYCFNNEARALPYLMKIGGFFNTVGAANINDGYTPAGGTVGTGNRNMAFIGPAGVAGMAASFPNLLNEAFSFGVSHRSGDYFKDSMRVISMLMMSGNFLDAGKL